jgi:hypothetical protein
MSKYNTQIDITIREESLPLLLGFDLESWLEFVLVGEVDDYGVGTYMARDLTV